MKFCHYMIFGMLMSWAICLSAQEASDVITLEQALNETFRVSPKIERARSQSEEATWKRIESYSGFLPTVSISGNYLTDKRYLLTNMRLGSSQVESVIPQIIPNSSFTLGAQIPIFDGFGSTNRYRAARAVEDSTVNEYEWAKFQQERAVTLQFYRTLGAALYKEVAEQNLKTLQDHLKDIQLFKKAGMSTNYDVLRVEVQVNDAKMEVLNATDNVDIAKEGLNEIIGTDLGHRDVKGKLPVLSVGVLGGNQNAILSPADLSSRRDIVALEERVQSLDYLKWSSYSAWIPKFSLFSQYQYYNNLTDELTDTESYRTAYQIGVSFTWTLFDGMSSIARSKQSSAQYYQAQKSLQEAKLKLKKDIELWRRKFLYFCSVYQTKEEDVAKATESVRLAREGRKVGSRTNTDLLDAEMDLFRARAGVVSAQIGAVEALINYELTLGKKLFDFSSMR